MKGTCEQIPFHFFLKFMMLGYRGGDTGHGGRTYFRIKDAACTDMDIHVIRDRFGDAEGFEVMLGGDCELETMIRALKFITKVLEEEAQEVYD